MMWINCQLSAEEMGGVPSLEVWEDSAVCGLWLHFACRTPTCPYYHTTSDDVISVFEMHVVTRLLWPDLTFTSAWGELARWSQVQEVDVMLGENSQGCWDSVVGVGQLAGRFGFDNWLFVDQKGGKTGEEGWFGGWMGVVGEGKMSRSL